jgi:arabinose-5-phosphate isomerase
MQRQPTRPDIPKSDDISIARTVLSKEEKALHTLANTLDETFCKVIDLMEAAQGRIVVTGMGKSGHVGAKIAATLASLGTPAQYVNAAEASHGDLGMITREDVVLALSNSGNTPELLPIINYTQLRKIPLIGLVGRAKSNLHIASEVSLVLDGLEEACPLNLAPTTSTTAMMALGDAIAVALMKRSGFSTEDFSIFHPGGQLGRKFLRVRDVMHSGETIPLVNGSELMSLALIEMTTKSFGCVGVLGNSGELVGIITDGDLRRHMEQDLLQRKAREVMTPEPLSINEDMLVAKALGLMNEQKITSLFVVTQGNIPAGIIHIHDLLREGIG